MRLRRRRDELARCGIHPVWSVPGDFGRIEGILEELDADNRPLRALTVELAVNRE